MSSVSSPTVDSAQAAAYGVMGLPLAFVALPLYVTLPNFYAKQFGVSLALLGALLLCTRLLDALTDPVIGRISDRLFAKSPRAILAVGMAACITLLAGFTLLFFPQVQSGGALIVWAAICLAITYLSYSTLSISHQAWGAMLGGNESQRSRIVGWREGFGLAGVLLASVLPVAAGMTWTAIAFALALVVGFAAWSRAPRPSTTVEKLHADAWLPFRRPAFVKLLSVFVVSGVASAIPATLILFFVEDRLQAPASMQPVFLGSYFLCAALSMPLWLALVKKIGLAKSWLCGMVLSVVLFAGASLLGAGQAWLFVGICVMSGAALGADLALPGALLAGLIGDHGDRGRADGAYFGWWNFATKLNLALAAGLVLPLLGLFGYAPGSTDPSALRALTAAYCLIPCALKLIAGAALWHFVIKSEKKEVFA